MVNDDSYIFEAKKISKKYYGTDALKDVNLSIKRGEIHALVGENGAGKSTLAKIIAGAVKPNEGRMFYNNKNYIPKNILDAHKKGISILYQEPNLQQGLTVAENIFLGNLHSFVKLGIINWKKIFTKAKELLGKIGDTDIKPNAQLSELTVGQKKLVELVRALSSNPNVLIVDETTAALNAVEVDLFFHKIKELKARKVSIIYISHRLQEIFKICDRITVLKDGRFVRTLSVNETNENELSSLMVGREINKNFYNKNKKLLNDKIILKVEDISAKNIFRNISFEVKSGEILGVGGLIGSGNEDILKSLFGLITLDKGEVYINGFKKSILNPLMAIENKIAYIPKERDEEGLIPIFSIKENICMSILPRIKKNIFLSNNKMQEISNRYKNLFNIKTISIDQPCLFLSGGNRQKVVISKWLATDPNVLLLNNPTRGVDIGAKIEIYKIINDLANSGLAVIIASDELPELIGLSDKIVIMRRGEISYYYKNYKPSEEEIIKNMI